MKSQTKLFVVALFVVTLIVGSASAATVTFTLDLIPPGTFELTASASLGDNSGITTYGIPLTGPILTLDHGYSPYAVSPINFSPAGFTNLRSGDIYPGSPNPSSIVSASQPLPPNPWQITGFGQFGSDWRTEIGGVAGLACEDVGCNPNIPWSAPLVIAVGTYDTTLGQPGFDTASSNLLANVYALGDTSTRIPAQVVTQVLVIPEPTTLMLAIAAFWGLAGARPQASCKCDARYGRFAW